MLELRLELHRGAFELDLDLRFDAPVCGLFGASGSGKTSLLHCIAGLVRPDRGYMKLAGETLFDDATNVFVSPHLRQIGLVFQDAQLFPHLSVRDNLLFGFQRRRYQDRRFELGSVVELLEIGHLLERRPKGLSGGEKQRVALGRALLFSPRLLLLDEPLAALDGHLKRQISPFLRRIRNEVGIPMIYVSHALDEILYLTNHLTVMASGRALGQGHHLDVLGAARSDSALPGDFCNVLTTDIERNCLDLGYSEATLGALRLSLPLAPVGVGRSVTLGVRASQIALAQKAVEGTTIQNQLPGRIVRIIPRHHGVVVEVDVQGAMLAAEISSKALEGLAFQVGDQAFCLIKSQAFEYLDSYQGA